ncbi:MAG: BNR-4 repeat-containing protein [Planctomycetota bacterium]|nr:BNR-4 repeat-containing protein [Planctomycetota bacterium]
MNLALLLPLLLAQDLPTADGYRGIWYANQPSGDEYAFKYSGGLGTYCAKHRPFAIHRPEVDRTFFVYGGAPKDGERRLLHMVSYFDHESGTLPRPTILLDKETGDAHDNPALSMDEEGHLWIFSTSHGRGRPSFVHRSREPYAIDAFEKVEATYVTEKGERASLDNFSYFQVWHVPGRGFAAFFTRYNDLTTRTSLFMTSKDGTSWSRWQRLAAIGEGHYQVSAAGPGVLGACFNQHPPKKGLNWRTNLYYLETRDHGERWQNVAGEPLEVPLREVTSPALVHDYAAEGKNVYLKDLVYDDAGRPVILYLTSGGYRSGPVDGPRTWKVARWTGDAWARSTVTTSDNNYDMGSLLLAGDTWRIVAPVLPGPQRFNTGGEMALLESTDEGATWSTPRPLTAGSERNHTYARRVLDADPNLVALWADGHGREPSASRLYFCDADGAVFRLPAQMEKDAERPEPVELVR